MKAIRAGYREGSADASVGGWALIMTRGRQREVLADKRRDLRKQQNVVLEPYENLKLSIDDLLVQLDSAKNRLQNFIDQIKIEEQTKKQEREAKLRSLRTFHTETPPPDTPIVFTPREFTVPKPPQPPEGVENLPRRPSPPTLLESGIRGKIFSGYRQRIENENQQLLGEYEKRLAQWEQGIREAELELEVRKQEYSAKLKEWELAKENFQKAEQERKRTVEEERFSNVDAMKSFLTERLANISFPLNTAVSFHIENNGEEAWLDVKLPEFENWPMQDMPISQQRRDYIIHIHSIGFRLIGETFLALPKVSEVILSGYVEHPSKTTGQIKNEYLLSAKVSHLLWSKLLFDYLNEIDVVDCFERFQIRRQITKQGEMSAIEPFKV